MEQLNQNIFNLWKLYKNHVRKVILNYEPVDAGNVSYWRNSVFCTILTYLTPLSLIALIPSVVMAFRNGLQVVGIADLVTFFTVIFITAVPGIKLKVRKVIFIFILYCLSATLLYYLPVAGPGLLFSLTVTIFSALMYSSSAAYLSAWVNTGLCFIFAVLVYFGIESGSSSSYDLGSWIAVSSNLVLLSFACATCIDLLIKGLTNSLKENRIAEEKLEKANRLYKFISQINQTIVHVKDAETLFRESCRIALEFGQYKMAWIGKFDLAQKGITLLDSRGISLQEIESYTSVPYEINSPQDYVLRTGKYFLSNDIEITSGIESWKPYAEANNIHSFIVLPIKKSGSIFGTYNLFATGINYFDTDDIALLLEVTDDISFALELFEKTEKHRQVEDLVLKKENLFRVLIEKSLDMKTLATAEGNIKYASPAVSKVLGYPVEEFLETSVFKLIHPEDLSALIEKTQNILKTPGKSFYSQHRILHKNKKWIWCEGTFTNMLHESGIEAMVSNFRDISEIKEAEIELKKNFVELESIYQEQSAIFNTLPASIALLDDEGTILKVNDEWVNFGRSNGLRDSYQHLTKNYIEISESSLGVEAKDGMKMAQGLQEILRGEGTYFTMEYPCDSPTEKRWFKAEVKPFRSHHLTGAVVMHINISERKKIEAEMLLLINNTEEAFVLLNNNLQIVSFNNQFDTLYKEYFKVDIKKGELILDYVQPHRKEIVDSIYKSVLEGNCEESEIEVASINNTSRNFSIKYSPAKDELGIIFGAFVTVIDITEKKKAEDQKEFDRRDKEALINSTNDLIWSISNDFKLIAANNSFISEIKKYTGVDIKHGEDLLSNDVYPAEYLMYWKQLYSRALSGESFKIEIYAPNVSGRDESWTETSFSPIIVNEQIAGTACYSRNITEQKKAAENLILTSTALQHALNDLNKIMDSSLDVICAVNKDGIFLKVSAASETVWGYKPSELIGKPIFDIVYQDDIEKTKLSATDVMSGKNQKHFRNRYVRKDGSLVPIEWTARWDAKDQIRYGVARDVSEKERLEKAIEIERQRFYDLFSEAPSSMGVMSGPNHIFEMVNPLYLQLIGKEDIIGKTVKEVLPEASNQGLIDILDGVYKTGKTFSTNEMPVKLDIHGSGQLVEKYLNFMYQAHRTEGDVIDGILFFAVDVTEQVLLRQKIEDSETKLKEAHAIAHISNWEIDLLTNSQTWSDEFYNISGISKGDKQPSIESFLSFIHPEDLAFAQKKIQRAFETFEPSSMNFRIISRNNTLKYGYAEWKFEFDINNTPTRLYGILQDVTESKIAEQEREKLIHELLQRNRDLEQFTFIISHNLRAPTANIIGFTEILQDQQLTLPEQREVLHGLASSVLGLDNIIKDINSILQVKREINERKEDIYFYKLVNDIMDSIGNNYDKSIVFINRDFTEVDKIFSLKVYMHSIFFNLISNSIKYRKPDEKLLIEIKSKSEKGKIILTFKDNGLGIDMKSKGDKVFGLYKRFHSHVEGKGMGLFMVKTQVEAIGGVITVESELNKGTEFTIVFEN